MKAIYINVTEKSVTEVNMENSLNAFYEKLHCRLVEFVGLGQKQLLVIDEEGHCRKNSPGHFRFKGNTTIFAGHALIVSEKGEDFGSAGVPAEAVREMIEFLELSEKERPKPRVVLVSIDDLSPESIARGRAAAARKLAEELNKK